MKVILDLCGGTGAWSKPYADAGYDVRNITLPEHDVRTYQPPDNVYGILAAPPCTMFSRARTTAKTKRDWAGAMEIVYACLKIIWECQYDNQFYLKFWALENPVGHLKRFLGKPALIFQPFEYKDEYSKKTCLWGMFKNPAFNLYMPLSENAKLKSRNNTRKLPDIPQDYKRDGLMSSIQIKRSITSPGFSKAFFGANR